jgi:glycosyltransferase involved in cell wall biosynthesis
MRVLQINNYGYVRGGSDRYYIDLGRMLSNYGHEVYYMTADNPENIVDSTYAVKGINIYSPRFKDLIKFFYSFNARKVIKDIIKTKKPQIAHLHIYYGQITSSILPVLKKYDIPIVQTLHEYKLLCPVSTLIRRGRLCEKCADGNFLNAIIYRCNRGSLARTTIVVLEAYISRLLGAVTSVNHFIAVSDFVRTKMIKYGIPSSKITTVYNFIRDDLFFENNLKGEYFLYYGRIEMIKGVKTLINAMKRLKDVELFIVGSGEAEEELKRYVALSGQKNIRFLGFKTGKELERLIDGSICAIVPSECNETFGLTVVESFARCRPVIVSDMGALPEIVTDGVDGFIFKAGDVEQLHEKLQWMAQHRNEAIDMGVMGFKKALNRFSSKRHYEEIMKIYNREINR